MRENWEIKKLAQVSGFQNGFAFKSKTFKEEGIPVIRITNIQDQSIDFSKVVYVNPKDYDKDLTKYHIVKGDLLIAMSGATTGKIGINNSDNIALLNQRVGKFEPNEDLLKLFLYYFLSSKVEESLAISAGSAQPNLSTEQIKSFEIPIPPIEEQKEIVEILYQAFESIDKAKANIEKNIENATELFESRQKKYFDELSKNLVLTPILEACEKIFAGGDKPKDYFSKTKTSDCQIPVISNGEKNDGLYGFTKTPKVTKPSVTVSARGTIGFTVFRNYPFVPIVRLIVLTPNEDIIIPEFLMRVLKTLDILRTGSSIPQLTVPMIKSYSIPVPDLEKQKEIVETLDIVDNHVQSLLSSYEEELKNLEELKKSILQKAFSGELTSKNKAA